MPPAVPSGCSRTSRPKNPLSPARAAAGPAAAVPPAGSAPVGVNCDTSPIGPTHPKIAAARRTRAWREIAGQPPTPGLPSRSSAASRLGTGGRQP